MLKNLLAGIAAGALSLAATAVMAQDYKYDEIVVAVQSLPGTLEPTQDTSIVGLRIMYNLYNKLIEYDQLGEMELSDALAESWEFIDETTFVLHLREGVKFHDGTDMTAEDVVFTFGPERMMSPDAPAYGATRAYFSNIVAVEALDDYTVQMTLGEPDAFFPLRLGAWTGEVISKDAYEAAGGMDGFALNVVGTGAYRVGEIRPGESITLEAFPDHFRGAPAAERVVFRAVPETATRVAGLLSGEFDIVTDIPPDQLRTIDDASGVESAGGPILNHRILVFRQDGANADLMQDVHLRRALSLSIDRQLLVDTIWGGRTVVPEGHQWPEFGDLFIPRGIPQYDLEKAKEELALSSYDGETLQYPVVDYYVNGIPYAEAMTQMWAEAGIDVELTIVESNTQRDALRPDIGDWSNSLPYPDVAAGLWRLWQPDNLEQMNIPWHDEEFAEQGRIVELSQDAEERRQAQQRLMDIWEVENPGGTVLHQNGIFYGVREGIEWSPYALQAMDFGPLNLK